MAGKGDRDRRNLLVYGKGHDQIVGFDSNRIFFVDEKTIQRAQATKINTYATAYRHLTKGK